MAALTVATAIGVLALQIRESVKEITPQAAETIRQSKITAFELQGMAKALKQEATDPEALKERQRIFRSTNVVLGQTARVVDQLNRQTLPQLTSTIAQSERLVVDTNRQVNTLLLPEATRATKNLADLAEAFKVDQHELLVQLALAVESGKVSLDSLSKLLNSNQLAGLIANVNSATGHFDATAANISEASKRLPTLSQEIEGILRTSNRFARPLMIAALLSTLARIFF